MEPRGLRRQIISTLSTRCQESLQFQTFSSTDSNRSLRICLIIKSSVCVIMPHINYMFWGKMKTTLKKEKQAWIHHFCGFKVKAHVCTLSGTKREPLQYIWHWRRRRKEHKSKRVRWKDTAGHHVSECTAVDELWECCWQIPSVIIIYTICPTSVPVPLLIMKCIIQTQISAELFA